MGTVTDAIYSGISPEQRQSANRSAVDQWFGASVVRFNHNWESLLVIEACSAGIAGLSL